MLTGSIPTTGPIGPVTLAVTANGTAQPLSATPTHFSSFLIFNPSALETVWIGEAGVLATTAFFSLAPGQSLPVAGTDASLWYVVSDGTSTPVVVLGVKQ